MALRGARSVPIAETAKDMRECHIQPDWLLVYKVVKETLILRLIRT